MKNLLPFTAVLSVIGCSLSLADSMKEEALQGFSPVAKGESASPPPTAPSRPEIPSIFVHEPKVTEPSPAPPVAEVPSAAANAPKAAVILPGIEIKSSPVKDLGRDLKNHDDAVDVESKYAKADTLDSIINGKRISLPKRFFLGENAAVRAGASQRRLELMELERKVIIAMDTAKTADEKRSLRILWVIFRGWLGI